MRGAKLFFDADNPTFFGLPPRPPMQHGLRWDIHSLEATVGAGHDRVVLPPHAEIEGQLVGHVPTIADEEAVLPLAAGHLLVLNALADGARQSEQEARPLVVEVARLRAAAQRRRAARGEVEPAARVVEFRLPVVQVEEGHSVPAADVVASHRLRQVRRERVGALVAEDRHPAFEVAEDREAGVESGIARRSDRRRSRRRWCRGCAACRDRSCRRCGRDRARPASAARSRTSRPTPSSA